MKAEQEDEKVVIFYQVLVDGISTKPVEMGGGRGEECMHVFHFASQPGIGCI